jgi:Tripartite tricarboxylate transporter TctB family
MVQQSADGRRVMLRLRNPKDFWTGVIYLVVGLGAVLIARDYPLGTARRMGPAYFPTVLGCLLAAIGLVAVVRAFIQPGAGVGKLAVKHLAVVLGATILFGVLVRGAGLAAALIVLVLLSASASRMFRWGPSIALAIGLAAFSVLAFVWGLGLPIPAVGPWLGG